MKRGVKTLKDTVGQETTNQFLKAADTYVDTGDKRAAEEMMQQDAFLQSW